MRACVAQYYRSITDEELSQLADDAWSLTDVAKQLLREELSRRGLTFELRESPPVKSWPELVRVRQFRDLPEALLAKSILDSVGINRFLQDENTIRLDWLWSNAIGGVRLIVKEEDAADAAKLLDQKPAESFETSLGEYKQPRCPACGSVNISYGEKGKSLAYATVALGVPLPVTRSGWRCSSCGHQWDDSAEPQQNEP
jgi:Putative prokaryotic signal transducing protein